MISYYSHLFPQGADTIITEEILNRISEHLNSSDDHELGLKMPSFKDLVSTDSTRYNTSLPHQEFYNCIKKHNPDSPILKKMHEMALKIREN
jgi:hypothetical protein